MNSAPRFSWAHLGLVVLGGALGTAARAGLLLIEDGAWQDIAIPVVNLVGSFLLGLLTGMLSLRADSGASRAARLFLGTGVLGGFTTYSTFALQAVQSAPVWVSVMTAVAGVAVALLGLGLARLSSGHRDPAGEEAA